MVDYRELLGVSELARDAQHGRGVKVAVLDTGVPLIEDIFVCLSSNQTSESMRDLLGHATFIGSILFGNGEVQGICQKATACFIKVFDGLFARPITVARAIHHAVDNWHVDIINLSLGFSRDTQCPEMLSEACRYAYAHGVTVVASAGNDGGEVLWPAALPETICVGSTDGRLREPFSNTGEVDFVITGRDLQGYAADGKLTTKSGTSFSTALITGILTLLIAARRSKSLETTPAALKEALITTCKDIHTLGYDKETGYGIPFAAKIRRSSHNYRLQLLKDYLYAKIITLLQKTVRLFRRTNADDK